MNRKDRSKSIAIPLLTHSSTRLLAWVIDEQTTCWVRFFSLFKCTPFFGISKCSSTNFLVDHLDLSEWTSMQCSCSCARDDDSPFGPLLRVLRVLVLVLTMVSPFPAQGALSENGRPQAVVSLDPHGLELGTTSWTKDMGPEVAEVHRNWSEEEIHCPRFLHHGHGTRLSVHLLVTQDLSVLTQRNVMPRQPPTGMVCLALVQPAIACQLPCLSSSHCSFPCSRTLKAI